MFSPSPKRHLGFTNTSVTPKPYSQSARDKKEPKPLAEPLQQTPDRATASAIVSAKRASAAALSRLMNSPEATDRILWPSQQRKREEQENRVNHPLPLSKHRTLLLDQAQRAERNALRISPQDVGGHGSRTHASQSVAEKVTGERVATRRQALPLEPQRKERHWSKSEEAAIPEGPQRANKATFARKPITPRIADGAQKADRHRECKTVTEAVPPHKSVVGGFQPTSGRPQKKAAAAPTDRVATAQKAFEGGIRKGVVAGESAVQ